MDPLRDVAATRLDNALLLFDEFVRATVKNPDLATLRGLERRFAERLLIQPSYWSQIKGRSRQIGERLARQFEQCCGKPAGWMDQNHGTTAATGLPAEGADPSQPEHAPRDEDERFIVGLVLTYYRRHPKRARERLLDLLGEVLMPEPVAPAPAPASPAPPAARPRPGSRPGAAAVPSPAPLPDQSLWQQSQRGVAPLKRK